MVSKLLEDLGYKCGRVAVPMIGGFRRANREYWAARRNVEEKASVSRHSGRVGAASQVRGVRGFQSSLRTSESGIWSWRMRSYCSTSSGDTTFLVVDFIHTPVVGNRQAVWFSPASCRIVR
jgi:hypothetical protein